MEQGFRGNCDSQGKLGMCPSLAEPDSSVFSKSSVSSHKPQIAKSLWYTDGMMRKATAFQDGANKTAPPYETLAVNKYFVTVPVKQLQRNSFHKSLSQNKQLFRLFLHRFQLTHQAIQLAGNCPRVPILLNPILGQPTHTIPYAIQYRCKRCLFLQRCFQSQQQFCWWVCPEKSPLHV